MANSPEEFSQAISEEVTCPVCLEDLKKPKILNCSHNVCTECLERIFRSRKSKDIACPKCRKPTRIPKEGLRSLTTNAAIVRVVEATLARKAKIEMKESLATGKPMVELLAKKISDINKSLRVIKEIHEKADKLVDVIRDQEASLCREVEEYYDIKCETINVEKSDLEQLHSSASKSVQEAETILKQTLSDSTKAINVAKVLKKQMDEVTELDLNQDISTRQDLVFESNADISSIFKDQKVGKLTYKINSAGRPSGTHTGKHQILATSAKKTMAKRYSKQRCLVCNSKASTHYCVICGKRSCKVCRNVVTRLPCESYKEHLLVKGSPTTSNEKADLVDSKDDCSFCSAKTASHNCIYCSKKACGTCQAIYTKDSCVLGSSALHHFVNQERQKLTSEKHETSSQKQMTLSTKDKGPNPVHQVTGENHCDFCGLAANLICKPCLKTICETYKYAYKQDLCPPTKREHQFENINEQSANTNEASGKDSRSLWSCERCTFLNSSSHRICAVCAKSRGLNQVNLPKSGSRKCQSCTYANEEEATICKMCSCTVGLDNLESYI